jgi:DNA-binding NarL/FixJ family response regulator
VRLDPEVLLLDLNLGGRSGLELQAELQHRHLPVRTVVLTMSAQPHQVAEALQLGACGYVLKGSPATELMAAIELAVQGKKFLGANVADLALEAFTQKDEDPLSLLSPRERQIILMVVRGESSAAIGVTLHLSPKTVATYRSRLMKKLGVHDVPGLVRLALRYKLIDAET